MEVLIRKIPPMILSGKKLETSFSKNETSKLWRPFREVIKEKSNLKPQKYFSISRFGKEMQEGSLVVETVFEKCAAIEMDLVNCPNGFEEIHLEGGEYATVIFIGSIEKFQDMIFNFLQNWLPDSGYELDSRAHFETFDESYDPFSESSVELVWIPIKP